MAVGQKSPRRRSDEKVEDAESEHLGFGPGIAGSTLLARQAQPEMSSQLGPAPRNATSETWRSNAAGAGATAAIVGSFRNHCL